MFEPTPTLPNFTFDKLFSSASRKANDELSVVIVVNFSLKIFISQKLLDNFFSSLAWSFIKKVPMYCKNVDLVKPS